MTTISRIGHIAKRAFSPLAISAFLGGVIATIGVTAFAASEAMGGWHEMSVAAQDVAGGPAGHAHFMLTHLYKAVNATDAQKAQIEPIVKQAMVDLAPYHDQFSTAHTQLLALFGQSTIDRAALEQLRVQEIQQVDLSSKRLMQLVADIGDVLTPEQRQQLQAHIQAMHQHAKHG